ncbi:hypothetical protein LCGC14_1645800 [marine sediment metagenome]|uniref:GIY-YIG domain-containing protein n=1 Tax=marine sediment metagenome TaxID=412755 RepID=A0A0F9KY69_9ZZZZ
MSYIYGLTDLTTNELRYVGYTDDTLEKRCDDHWKERNHKKRTYKRNWIRKLYEEHNQKPKIFMIEEINPERWEEAETFWIEYFKFLGCNLTNVALGGKGRIKGTKLTEEHKKNIGLGCAGKKYPNRKSPEGGAWNKDVTGYTFKQGGKVAEGVLRPWQDGIKRSEHRRKEYIFVDPQDNIHNIIGLNAFCKEYNLNRSNMCQVAKGKLNSYKGWTAHTEEY